MKSKNTPANRALLNLPDCPAVDLLFKMDTPAYLTTPKLDKRVVWLNMYRQGCYPNGKDGTDNYYSGATIELVDLF